MATDYFSNTLLQVKSIILQEISSNIIVVLVVLLLVLAIMACCISGAESAYLGLSAKDQNFIKTRPQSNYKRVNSLLENPEILQGALLISKRFFILAFIIISNYLFDNLLQVPNFWLLMLIKLASLFVFIYIFIQVLPKSFANINHVRYAVNTGWFVEITLMLTKIPASWMAANTDKLERWLGKRSKSVTKEEMRTAIDLTSAKSEQNILKGILDFGDKMVKQVMRTRLDVSGIKYNVTFPKLVEQLKDYKFSRMPVYNSSLDEIKGMLHSKDVLPHLHEGEHFDWHQLIRPAYFVHENKFIEDLMKEFQQKRIHFAIVVDEFGGTSGIITLEDILEEVVGEISDEFDTNETQNKKIDDNTYVIEGKTMLSDVCKFIQVPMDTFDIVKGDRDSLAGLVLELAGEIPEANSMFQVQGFDFTVLEVIKNRINLVQVLKKPHEIPED